jgi:hypothetical protein
MNRTVILNPIEPAPLSVRAPLGIPLDLDLTFKNQKAAVVDPNTLLPQLVLLPRSFGGIFTCPVETMSSGDGTAKAEVPGTALVDTSGYTLELYSRRVAENPDDPPVATGLIAKGVLVLEGSAYGRGSSLQPMVVPVVVGPPGPQGPQGEQGDIGPTGQRGSLWTSGEGPPALTGFELTGDMYLDELTGDIYRFEAGVGWVLQ